ncbi:hypothetical protein HZB02_02315 [Candidatus Woesearchaeota archaeon]|nr:hypothetical protein [Candidatus Woesearchaeota archaeon]
MSYLLKNVLKTTISVALVGSLAIGARTCYKNYQATQQEAAVITHLEEKVHNSYHQVSGKTWVESKVKADVLEGDRFLFQEYLRSNPAFVDFIELGQRLVELSTDATAHRTELSDLAAYVNRVESRDFGQIGVPSQSYNATSSLPAFGGALKLVAGHLDEDLAYIPKMAALLAGKPGGPIKDYLRLSTLMLGSRQEMKLLVDHYVQGYALDQKLTGRLNTLPASPALSPVPSASSSP